MPTLVPGPTDHQQQHNALLPGDARCLLAHEPGGQKRESKVSCRIERRQTTHCLDHTVRQEGFTLLEMMVVLVIIGIATTLVSVTAFGNDGDRTLRQDAMRLTQLFTAAQVQARAGGRSIVWEHNGEGYRFIRLPRTLILPARLVARSHDVHDTPFAADSVLRPRAWRSEEPVSVRITPGERLVFGPEWIPGPMRMELASGGQTIRLARLGSGRFVVEDD